MLIYYFIELYDWRPPNIDVNILYDLLYVSGKLSFIKTHMAHKKWRLDPNKNIAFLKHLLNLPW